MSNKPLLQMIQETNDLEGMLVESGGEITPEIETQIAIREIGIPEKVEAYALVIERMRMLEEFYKERADKILLLSRGAKGVIERLQLNLKIAMEGLGVEELEGVETRFKLQRSPPSVVIEDESKIDGAYVITETKTTIDKKTIAEDLKIGVPVEGARLMHNTHIRIYSNNPARRKEKK